MDILFLLIPISLILVGLIIFSFLWAIQSGQFDDLEGPAHEILMDNDDLPESRTQSSKKQIANESTTNI